ncbi:MAG TPA: hypothetical protein VF916_08705, partial [Ktedonobacterales bacterium]
MDMGSRRILIWSLVALGLLLFGLVLVLLAMNYQCHGDLDGCALGEVYLFGFPIVILASASFVAAMGAVGLSLYRMSTHDKQLEVGWFIGL